MILLSISESQAFGRVSKDLIKKEQKMAYTYELKRFIRRVEETRPERLAKRRGAGISEDEPCREGRPVGIISSLLLPDYSNPKVKERQLTTVYEGTIRQEKCVNALIAVEVKTIIREKLRFPWNSRQVLKFLKFRLVLFEFVGPAEAGIQGQ